MQNFGGFSLTQPSPGLLSVPNTQMAVPVSQGGYVSGPPQGFASGFPPSVHALTIAERLAGKQTCHLIHSISYLCYLITYEVW